MGTTWCFRSSRCKARGGAAWLVRAGQQHGNNVVLQVLKMQGKGRSSLVGEGRPTLGLDSRTKSGVLLVHRVHRGVDQIAELKTYMRLCDAVVGGQLAHQSLRVGPAPNLEQSLQEPELL